MKTIQTILLTYILGFGLQSFAIIFCIYVFNKQKIILKNYLFISILLSIVSGLVRLLPISLGVHTIINMLFTYLICVMLLKMPAYTTIRSTSLCVVIILVCEMLVTSLVMVFKGQNYLENVMNNSLHRSIIGIIANLVFALLVVFIYFVLKKKGDYYRDISSKDC